MRWRGEQANGFVEVDFASGAPELFVEMILSPEAYAEFCLANRVEVLPPENVPGEHGDWDWRLADATATRFT